MAGVHLPEITTEKPALMLPCHAARSPFAAFYALLGGAALLAPS
ncbi:MAG TPA: hypothetical protein VMJ64_01130 [Anaerolineales bacterium]|nr:hypothetical protein [Anaerolineales bacterium]